MWERWIEIGAIGVFAPIVILISGALVWIRDDEVGIVIRKWSRRSLEAHRQVALHGEAGVQADTLTPGLHGLYWPWQFTIRKASQVNVAPGEIALVIANDGLPTAPEQLLGNAVECNNFQDGRAFLTQGGQQGRQRAFLTAGRYRINTMLFTVITSDMASEHGLDPEALKVFAVPPDRIGVVTIAAGSGSVTGQLVDPGSKGVWRTPLWPGRHPVNTFVMHVEIVPTHQITLDWSNDASKPATNYDAQLRALELTSKDGFTFEVAVTQVLCIDGVDAPQMISLIGSTLAEERGPLLYAGVETEDAPAKFDSIRNLVTRVLKNLIDNHFRISAQNHAALDFLEKRSDRQREAIAEIATGLRAYGVQSVGTFISRMALPPALMAMLSDRKLAEEEQKTIAQKKDTERERTELMYLRAVAETQRELAETEQRVKIARLQAEAERVNADSRAESILTISRAHTAVMRENQQILGSDRYLEMETLKQLVQIRLPEVLVTGAVAGGSPLDAAVLHALRRVTGDPGASR